MNRKIHRRCKCGCGGLAKPGNLWIWGHNSFGNTHCLRYKHTKETKKRMSLAAMGNANALGYKFTKEAKKKISKRLIGNTYGKALKGKKQTKEHIKNAAISQIKYDPNYQYCDIWKDKEYKSDIRKDYCENINCKGDYKHLCNHHIYLDKKRCAPNDIMTLCNPCHVTLHHLLETNPQDYIIINRPDRVSYIHKRSREMIKIAKRHLDI